MRSEFDHTPRHVVLADTRTPDPIQAVGSPDPTGAAGVDRLQCRTNADADLGTTEVDHAAPPGRPVPHVTPAVETVVVLRTLVGPGADVGPLDAVLPVAGAEHLAATVVDVARPARIAGL